MTGSTLVVFRRRINRHFDCVCRSYVYHIISYHIIHIIPCNSIRKRFTSFTSTLASRKTINSLVCSFNAFSG